MAKPDPALLDAARYPFHYRIEPRFGDLDVNMHVNNVSMCRILEEGRVRFHHASGYERAISGMTGMAVSFAVEYLGEAAYPDAIDVHVAMIDIGRTSHTLAQVALQNGQPVAFARTVLVNVAEGRPVANAADFLAAIYPWRMRA